MLNPIQMAQEFFAPKKKAEAANEPSVKKPEPEASRGLEDPHVKRVLNDFFSSSYWPYVRDLMMMQIIEFQTRVDKQLQGSLGDPKDSSGKMAAYHGGRLKAGDEIKLILDRLKKNYSQ